MPRKRPIVKDATRAQARRLRHETTGPERALWSVLRRGNLLGLHFRQQHPIGPFVVDFYCAAAGLVIELDGESHVGRAAYDDQRTAYLHQLSLHVLRFTNDDVLGHLDAVFAEIEMFCRNATSPPLKGGAGGGISQTNHRSRSEGAPS